MIEPNDDLLLINHCLILFIFSVIIIYDISKENNKIQFYLEEVKNIINIFIFLNECIYKKCKISNTNEQQQSNIILISCQDLNINLSKIIYEVKI